MSLSWWATALQPIIFISSAVVSGMAVLLIMYTVIRWRSRAPYDYSMVKNFVAILWGIFFVDYALEVLELAHVYYRQGHEWAEIGPLLAGPLFRTYVIGQMGIRSAVPFLVLGYVVLSPIRGKTTLYLANLGSLFLVAQVLLMRFNVVIGGQLISKSVRGFVDFHWELLGREGILTASLILAAPFVAYYVIGRFIPIFDEPAGDATLSDHP